MECVLYIHVFNLLLSILLGIPKCLHYIVKEHIYIYILAFTYPFCKVLVHLHIRELVTLFVRTTFTLFKWGTKKKPNIYTKSIKSTLCQHKKKYITHPSDIHTKKYSKFHAIKTTRFVSLRFFTLFSLLCKIRANRKINHHIHQFHFLTFPLYI